MNPSSRQFFHLRLRLLQPIRHTRFSVHRRRGGDVLLRLVALARAPVDIVHFRNRTSLQLVFFSFTSSKGATNGYPAMSPIPDSSTLGPTPPNPPISQIGANIALSWISCWIRSSTDARLLGSSSAACSRTSPSISA